jgi:osomolarity two-component system sensor histidine kinase NIK1
MFDAVIVDDLGVVEKLREIASIRYVPIVLLVLGEPKMKMKTCIDLGIASYIHAPLRYPDVMNALLPAMESHVVLPDSSGQPRTRLHILLAEDNIVNQKLAVRILEKFGHRVSIVSNGRMAVEAVQKDTYDLILMDVQMPIMGGFEATQRIREWERCTEVTHPIPIIALTAHAMIGDREKCMAAGMDEYITKPLRFNELIATINKFVVKIENGMSAEHHGVV